MKKLFNVMLKITLIGIILSPFIFLCSYINITDNQDTCLDTGFCKEGLSLNIEGEKIIVNEHTCKENDGHWYQDKKACQFR